jgi:hypothetical protein
MVGTLTEANVEQPQETETAWKRLLSWTDVVLCCNSLNKPISQG